MKEQILRWHSRTMGIPSLANYRERIYKASLARWVPVPYGGEVVNITAGCLRLRKLSAAHAPNHAGRSSGVLQLLANWPILCATSYLLATNS